MDRIGFGTERVKPKGNRCSICLGQESEGLGPLVSYDGAVAHRYCVPTFLRRPKSDLHPVGGLAVRFKAVLDKVGRN